LHETRQSSPALLGSFARGYFAGAADFPLHIRDPFVELQEQ
jgi:hypothetical protein